MGPKLHMAIVISIMVKEKKIVILEDFLNLMTMLLSEEV